MDNVVSVIIPVYNTAQYVKTCYLSVSNQTYPDIEIILINDASPDDSAKVLRELTIDTNKRLVHCYEFPENKGLSYARNFGLERATGDYIAFLDSDDWYDSNYLTKMVGSLKKADADIAICGIMNEMNNIYTSSVRYFYDTTTTITGDYALKLLSRAIRNDVYITPMVGNKLFRKRFLLDNNLRFVTGTCHEDDIFSFSLFTLNPTVVLVADTNQHYYQRENSITHTFSKKRIDDLIDAFVRLKADLQLNGKLNTYKKEYMSFFDRCISTTFQCLADTGMSTLEKKGYISYFLQRLFNEFSLAHIVEYIDLDRIYAFIGIGPQS